MSAHHTRLPIAVALTSIAGCAAPLSEPLANHATPKVIHGTLGVIVVGDAVIRDQVQQRIEDWLQRRGYQQIQFVRNPLPDDILSTAAECLERDDIACILDSGIDFRHANLVMAHVAIDRTARALKLAVAWLGGGSGALTPCNECTESTWRTSLAGELEGMAAYIEEAVDSQEHRTGRPERAASRN